MILEHVHRELDRPLAAMRERCEAMLDTPGHPSDPSRDQYIRTIAGVCEGLIDLNRLYREYASLTEGNPPVRRDRRTISSLVAELDRCHSGRAGGCGVTWLCALEGKDAIVETDAGRLVSALGELIENALNCTPRGALVAVSAGREGSGWWVRVADEGPGIPEELRARVCDPFFRLPGAGGSGPERSGLGLAVCRATIVHLGGALSLGPNEPTGTVARVRLPVAIPAARG